jgi:TRAP-type C4-dicarboxylate transport system substrate-binding protein
MMKNWRTCITVFLAIILAIAVGSAGAAEKSITIRYASPYSPKHPQAIPNVVWMEKMEKETNGRLKFKAYFGGTLMSPKESYAELQKGVADATTVTVAYSPHGFDLHKGIFPFMYGEPNDGLRRKIFKEIAAKFPEIYAEFKDVKILRLSTGSNYQLVTTKPVRNINDLKGMSIKATGHYVQWVKGAGGEGVPLPMSETYIALQKGTVDGLLAPVETMKTFKFAEVAKYVTVLNITSTPYPGEAMNLNTWNSLPADLQDKIADSQEWWESEYDRVQETKNQEGKAFAKSKGVEFIEPAPEDLSGFYELLKKVCLDSARKLDQEGFQGTAIFNEIRLLVEKNSQ